MESVAAFAWNGWQASSGISGNLGLEYATKKQSKAETVRGIRDNRRKERDVERAAQTNARQPDSSKPKSDVTYLHGKPDDGAFPDFLDELFGDDE